MFTRIARCLGLSLIAALALPASAQAPDCTGISTVRPTSPDLIGELASIRVATGLLSPVHLTTPQGDNERLFVVEQPGRIKIIKNGAVLNPPFLDITAVVDDSGNEEGLLSMAFHPEYSDNGMFWVYYTDGPGNLIIARYEVSAGDPDLADASSGQIVLTVPHPTFSNHNGGQLAFGTDGALYVGTGDGGSGCDPGAGVGNGQNTNVLLGKLLRLNVGTGPVATYTTDGNPYVGNPAVRDEIWSYGLRNPYTFTVDRETGNLYIGDVGQGVWEEVDCLQGGNSGIGAENFGWVPYEGDHCPNPSCGASGNCNLPDYVAPIYEYQQSGALCSVISGPVYRGCRMAPLKGTYFFADFQCSGGQAPIWSFRTDATCPAVTAGDVTSREADVDPGPGQTIALVTSFGEDNRGEMYVVDRGGEVFKIIPVFGIHEVSGPGAVSLSFGANDVTFEDMSDKSDYSPANYRILRSDTPDGTFNCIRLVSTNGCSGGSCTWSGGDAAVPNDNEVFYYLVTATLGGEETSGGVGSDGTPRTVNPGGLCFF